jgi:hypothetical protein
MAVLSPRQRPQESSAPEPVARPAEGNPGAAVEESNCFEQLPYGVHCEVSARLEPAWQLRMSLASRQLRSGGFPYADDAGAARTLRAKLIEQAQAAGTPADVRAALDPLAGAPHASADVIDAVISRVANWEPALRSQVYGHLAGMLPTVEHRLPGHLWNRLLQHCRDLATVTEHSDPLLAVAARTRLAAQRLADPEHVQERAFFHLRLANQARPPTAEQLALYTGLCEQAPFGPRDAYGQVKALAMEQPEPLQAQLLQRLHAHLNPPPSWFSFISL